MSMSLLIQALIAGVTNGFVYALIGMGLAVIFKGSHVINAAQDVIAFSLLIVIMTALPHGMLGRAGRAGG